MKADNSAAHRLLIVETRKALGREPDFTMWLNSKGRWDAGEFKSTPGLGKGTADLIGILSVSTCLFDDGGFIDGSCGHSVHMQIQKTTLGRFVALEAKTGTGRLSPEQRMFFELVRSRGGFAAVFSTVDEARACLDRARAGECE